MTAACDASTGQ